jgi:hypothetical protein
MKTLHDKLVKYGFVKLNYFWYFWYITLLDRGVYNKSSISKILYADLNIGKARSILLEYDKIWRVFKTNKYLYISTINNQLYKLKL